MKRLTAGLTILVFLTFLNRPLFSFSGDPVNSGAVFDQSGTPFTNPVTTEDGNMVGTLWDSTGNGFSETESQISTDVSEHSERTDILIKEADKEIEREDDEKSTPSRPSEDRGDGPPKPSEVRGDAEEQDDFFGYETQIPPLRSVVEDLFEFVDEEEESLRRIDLKDGKLESSDSKFDVLTQLELQLAERIDAALFAIEENEINALDVIVLDAVEFTAQIRAIHQLLNPPARLDPLLKWLLYLNRVTPEMIELYQAALEKRDRIFLLAARSNGKLKIRYNGKILDEAVYAWPDQNVRYELVAVPSQPVVAPSGQPLS